jgi:hypothetical protein
MGPENDYRLAAVTEKTLTGHAMHLCFVDPASPYAEEITCNLLTIDSVEHADPMAVRGLLELETPVSDVTASDCPHPA